MSPDTTEETFSNIEQVIALSRIMLALEHLDEHRLEKCEAEYMAAFIDAKHQGLPSDRISDLALVALWVLMKSLPICVMPPRVNPCQN